jgi:hypothetical protein
LLGGLFVAALNFTTVNVAFFMKVENWIIGQCKIELPVNIQSGNFGLNFDSFSLWSGKRLFLSPWL